MKKLIESDIVHTNLGGSSVYGYSCYVIDIVKNKCNPVMYSIFKMGLLQKGDSPYITYTDRNILAMRMESIYHDEGKIRLFSIYYDVKDFYFDIEDLINLLGSEIIHITRVVFVIGANPEEYKLQDNKRLDQKIEFQEDNYPYFKYFIYEYNSSNP